MARTTQASERGFTLVELAVVVVIVGILSTLAVVGYRRIVASGRATEGQNMVQAIRIAQEAYRAEVGKYADIGWGTYCPGDGTGKVKTYWNPACNGGARTWRELPVNPDGPVAFGYRTTAGLAGTAPPAVNYNGTAMAWGTPRQDWYVIEGRMDWDGDGEFVRVIGSSFNNIVLTENDGD